MREFEPGRSGGVMSNIYSVLQSSYANNVVATPSKGTYTPVDAASYQGTWTGTYTKNNQKFSVQIENVQGFRAQVKVHDSNGVSYQNVLIKNSAFRVGDSKFVLEGNGTAQFATAVTDPVSGNVSVISGTATQS
jgi:hypothetical protein